MSRILIADDHPLFRLALRQAVLEVESDAIVEQAASVEIARELLARHPDIDLVLLDLHMPGSHGLMGLAALRGEYPAVAVVIVSAHDDPATIRRALAYGAAGFIPKRADLAELKIALHTVLNECAEYVPSHLRAAVAASAASEHDRTVAARLAALSPQHLRVLTLVAQGYMNKQIADRLAIQERTVKAHLSTIFERLQVRNRTQAGVLLQSLDLGDPARAI